MLALPSSDWRSTHWSEAEALDAAPAKADWRSAGEVEHGFTHFTLTLQILRAEGEAAEGGDLAGDDALFTRSQDAEAALGVGEPADGAVVEVEEPFVPVAAAVLELEAM